MPKRRIRTPLRHAAPMRRRLRRLDPNLRALLWSISAGLLFVLLNTFMRVLSLQLDPYETQLIRYAFGLLVMVPFMLRGGATGLLPRNITGQFSRGAVHTLGLYLWFAAVPHIALADTTAIGFTTPIFIMLGAAWLLHEKMRWERWVAALVGFAGVLIVVAPKLASGGAGLYTLVMLASAPIFAASFLMTKTLTRTERPSVIVLWQAITVTLFSLPPALWRWETPTTMQWFLFVVCGILGSGGHYCLTQSFRVADISASQSMKFLDLVWATLAGWIVFGDQPSQSTLMGGLVIFGATLWIARREARGARGAGN